MPFFIVTAYVLQGLFSNLEARNNLEHERGHNLHRLNVPCVVVLPSLDPAELALFGLAVDHLTFDFRINLAKILLRHVVRDVPRRCLPCAVRVEHVLDPVT